MFDLNYLEEPIFQACGPVSDFSPFNFLFFSNQVLDGLIEEDEDVVDTWYLLGWLNKLRADFERSKVTESKDEDISEGYLGNARYYLNKSMKVQQKTPSDDTELVSLK